MPSEEMKLHSKALAKLRPDSDAAHEYISANMTDAELTEALHDSGTAFNSFTGEAYAAPFRKHDRFLEAEKEMREEAASHDNDSEESESNLQFEIEAGNAFYAQDDGGPFYLEGKKIADNQIELAQYMKDEGVYYNVAVDQDGRGWPEIIDFDPDAVLIEAERLDDEYLEEKYKNYSFKALVNMVEELNEELEYAADGSSIEEDIEEIEAEQERRLREKKEYGGSFSSGGKRRSRTSGWSKLKLELPTSGAVQARLNEGGHSSQYRKVLEELKSYWEKRGR